MNHEPLPPAGPYYEQELGRLSRPNSKGWALGRCPFHPSKSGKTFSVNVNHGGFHCFGCDVKGDMIAFVRIRYHLDYKGARQRLGLDRDGKPFKPRRGPRVPFLVMDFVIDGERYRAEVNNEPKTWLQQLRRFHADAADRLQEIWNGDGEEFEGEQETQWGILASSWELIQMAEVGDGR